MSIDTAVQSVVAALNGVAAAVNRYCDIAEAGHVPFTGQTRVSDSIDDKALAEELAAVDLGLPAAEDKPREIKESTVTEVIKDVKPFETPVVAAVVEDEDGDAAEAEADDEDEEEVIDLEMARSTVINAVKTIGRDAVADILSTEFGIKNIKELAADQYEKLVVRLMEAMGA